MPDANHVKVYALTTCIHCRNAKQFLDQCGVKYDCVHVDQLEGAERQTAIEEVRRLNPACSFPTLIINGKVVVGYREDQIKEALCLP